ncbi:MAG TPA: caspase family protein, partial [Phaeodactylibacter sp.]|nr:caspase family protein [Phaeodactylibacter sp.]
MKKIFALLIGINNYPIASHRLNGCVSDRNAIHDFFEKYSTSNGLDYQPLLLTDEEATRQGIIDGFTHFEKANDGDICLFYYSGHGSQMPAPKEFWQDELDQKCETIVCHDSRIGQGRDLSDKELSYLIWKCSHKKNVHFLAIFDCCHAGTITRDVEVVNRMAEINPTPVFAKNFVGVESYQSHKGRLIPPESDHVTLSASRSYESSVELTLDGKRRGLFTYSLINVMNQSNLSNVSYSALMSKVQTRVHNRIDTQHPQINAQGKASVNQLFLAGTLNTNPFFIIKYNEKKGWILEMGAMHGIHLKSKIQVEHQGKLNNLKIKSIGSAQTIFHTESWMKDFDHQYSIKEISDLHKKLKITFFPQLENPQAKQYIHDLVKDWNVEYVEDTDEADYWMRLTDEGYILTRPNNERPVFKAIPENSGTTANQLSSAEVLFLQNVNKVARWEEVSELSNPLANGVADKELDVSFFQVYDHLDYITVKEEEPMDTNGDAVFQYTCENGVWENPNLRMSVKNISDRTLWIGALFLGEDFVITDAFMPVKEIRAGEEAYPLTTVDQNGYRVSVIPIHLPDELHSWGETEISNQIKIIASATPFSMDAYRQEGLELQAKNASKGASRGMGFAAPQAARPKILSRPSWFTKDIIYKIHRPQEGAAAETGKTLQMYNLTVEGHDSFSAERIQLSSSSIATRSAQRPSIQVALGSDNFQPLHIEGNTRSVQHGLDTIELHNVQGQENVTADNPLKIKLDISLNDNEKIFPFGYDTETKLYYPLGHPDEDTGAIRIEELPDAEEVVTRGFGKSLKIYLQKVVYQKLFNQTFPYPILAIANVDEQQNVTR